MTFREGSPAPRHPGGSSRRDAGSDIAGRTPEWRMSRASRDGLRKDRGMTRRTARLAEDDSVAGVSCCRCLTPRKNRYAPTLPQSPYRQPRFSANLFSSLWTLRMHGGFRKLPLATCCACCTACVINEDISGGIGDSLCESNGPRKSLLRIFAMIRARVNFSGDVLVSYRVVGLYRLTQQKARPRLIFSGKLSA